MKKQKIPGNGLTKIDPERYPAGSRVSRAKMRRNLAGINDAEREQALRCILAIVVTIDALPTTATTATTNIV